MASKKKVSLNDYEMTTTLGTGKLEFIIKLQGLSAESDSRGTKKLESILP